MRNLSVSWSAPLTMQAELEGCSVASATTAPAMVLPVRPWHLCACSDGADVALLAAWSAAVTGIASHGTIARTATPFLPSRDLVNKSIAPTPPSPREGIELLFGQI